MKAGTFLFATLCAYVTCFSDVTAQGDILEVAASLGCNQFVEWVNSTGLIPDALVDEADSYTLFAVRDEDIPIQIERLFSFISPVLLGNYLSHSFANGSYEAADFENDKLVDTATLYPYFVKQLRMNVYEVNGNTVYTIDGRPVISANHPASNGVVHIIEGFLIYEIETIGERIEASYDLMQDGLSKINLLDSLINDGPYTVFAPNNAAFNKLLAMVNNDTRIIDFDYPLTGILRGHIVRGTYFDDSLFTGMDLPTLDYKRRIQVTVEPDGNFTINGQARVVQQRYMRNGVIYELDTVLTIPSDLNQNTMVDVAQDLGANWMLYYLYRGELYDGLRETGPDTTLIVLEDVGFTDQVRLRLDTVLPVLLGNYMRVSIVNGTYRSADWENDLLIPTIDGVRNMRMNVYGTNANPIYTINGRPLKTLDQPASNGLVHTIQTFLTSESWATCGSFIELDPDLSILEERLISFGLLEVLKEQGPYTVFAPENDAFNGINVSNDTLLEILQGHVITGTYFTEGLEDGLELSSINDKVIRVTVDQDTQVLTLNGDVNIIGQRSVGNGVLHLLDGVLFKDGDVATTTVAATTTGSTTGVSTVLPSLFLMLLPLVLFFS